MCTGGCQRREIAARRIGSSREGCNAPAAWSRFALGRVASLVMLNYEVQPELLAGFLPLGSRLDCFQGETDATLVAFGFLRRKLHGLCAIPFHANSDEVSLRF